MKTDNEKKRALADFLYFAKRAVSDAKRRDISDRQFAGMIGITPASLSKYLNQAVIPSESAIDIIAANLDRTFINLKITDPNAMAIYDALDMQPRVSTADKRLIEIVHLWNRLTDEQRHALYEEFSERIKEVA